MAATLGGRRGTPLGGILVPVLVLLAWLLLIRAHMDALPSETRLLLASPGGLPGPAGSLLAWLYRSFLVGPGLPGWVIGLLPLAFFALFLPWSDRICGRGPGTPVLLLALGGFSRLPWLHGTAFAGSLLTVPLLLLLVPRRGPTPPAACLAALAVPPLALALGADHHLPTLVLAALVLADPGRGRGLLPALGLGLALLVLVPGAMPRVALAQGLDGWGPALVSTTPGTPGALGLLLVLAGLAARAPGRASPRERMVLVLLAAHTLLAEGSLPLLAFALLPRAARGLGRGLTRMRESRREGAWLAALVLALLLAPFHRVLGPRIPGRGLRLSSSIPVPLRLGLRQLDLRAEELLVCAPPARADARRISPRARLSPPLDPTSPDAHGSWRLDMADETRAEALLEARRPAAALVPSACALAGTLRGRQGWWTAVEEGGWSLFVGPRNLLR